MITIEEVVTRKQIKQFVKFPDVLYKGNKHYVPRLYADEMKIFGNNYPYCDQVTNYFLLAKEGEKVVGRLHVFIQHAYNKKNNTSRARFDRFETYEDYNIAEALFDKGIEWAKGQGATIICGPLGFSDVEREGMLVEGFTEDQTFAEQYYFPYAHEFVEKYGFKKEIDWLEFSLTKPDEPFEKALEIEEKVLNDNKLKVVDTSKMTKRGYFHKYSEKFMNLIDETYSCLYGTVPFTKKMKDNMVGLFSLVVRKDDFVCIVDEDDNLAAAMVVMPSISKAVQKGKGHINIPFLFQFIKDFNKPKIMDMLLIGVRDEYKFKGLVSAFLFPILNNFNHGVQSFETNLNLEDNHAIMECWKYFSARQHKRRRSYFLEIN